MSTSSAKSPAAAANQSSARRREAREPPLSVDLSAVVVAATLAEPRVLVLNGGAGEPDGLPSGPLTPEHRTLEAALRAWVEQQTQQKLGYVEQLYTFGDRNRTDPAAGAAGHFLSVAYLALVREMRPIEAT